MRYLVNEEDMNILWRTVNSNDGSYRQGVQRLIESLIKRNVLNEVEATDEG